MSALTDLFSAMANKIRSKTGTATTYTPSEMVSDGIDDVYDAGVASATTPITPSNSSPASMTANTGYKPTANGYAIASYSSVTPSSTQTAVSSGDIVKIGGSGVIVDSVPTPTSLTPSNSTPVDIASGGLYSATRNGKAVETLSDLTASNADPVPLYRMRVYRNVTGSGSGGTAYAIESYSDVTPSDSTPPSISSGDIVRSSASGYLYATQQSGGMTQTTLWTNNSPTSVFAGSTITLSSAITNYDYIGIKYKSIHSSSTATPSEILITPDNLKRSKQQSGAVICCIGVYTNNYNYVRTILYSTDTKLTISIASAVGLNTTNTSYAIPLNVYGYKL